ncbi:MAG TPA: S8 family serine peptidase [Steroidobacteraceae bacterium]|nr:S8 family serine peptidase [Steroidobacteraceae bacterium]
MRVFAALFLLALTHAAAAQIGVPTVRLPAVGVPNVPAATAPLDATLARADDVQALRELRHLHVRELLRHRDVIEADPHGAPIVRGEILALAAEDASPPPATADLTALREVPLAGLGLRLRVLHASGDTARTLQRVRRADPAGAYDFNHVFTGSGLVAAPAGPGAAAAAAGASVSAMLGLIDSGVDGQHEVFAGVTLHQHGCAGRPVPDAHGTAVASLLVGRAAALHGAAPGATLYAADVFCGLPTGGAVDAVAEALDWLARERVAVINVSLVGPPNTLLGEVLAVLLARGHLVVAAVGNDGPAAAPLYPAAFPGVIGVTAVDARGRILPEAGRGAQVKFAAPGADMAAASTGHGFVRVRGTSFAAPLVAGLLAAHLSAPDKSTAEAAVASLAQGAQRLSQPVPNPISGYGLVGAELRPQPALAGPRAD